MYQSLLYGKANFQFARTPSPSPFPFTLLILSDQENLRFLKDKNKMGMLECLYPTKPIFLPKFKHAHLFTPTTSSKLDISSAKTSKLTSKMHSFTHSDSHSQREQGSEAITILMGATAAGITLFYLVGPSSAVESPTFSEPSNALSLPTWAVHVSSVVEWATAMALVWQYGEKSGYESWKGLSWGMVPLLGGALCACTWHFFYNSESLEVLVALQAALTVIGNATMCFAAYRIYISSQECSKNS